MKPLYHLLAIIAVLLAGALWWLHSRFAPLAEMPQLKLVPGTFQPSPPGPLREIDLGYARLSVPSRFDGELVRYDDRIPVSFLAGDQQQPLLIWWPLHESDPDLREAYRSFEAASGEPFRDHFEFEKRALSAQPPSFWRILTSSAERRKIALLGHKLVSLSGATEVRLYEHEQIGAVLVRGNDTFSLQLYERTAGVSQVFYLQPRPDHDLDATVSAIVTTYRVTSEARTEEEFLALVRAAGIPAKLSPAAEDTEVRTEQQRLHEVAEEVRARRAENRKP